MSGRNGVQNRRSSALAALAAVAALLLAVLAPTSAAAADNYAVAGGGQHLAGGVGSVNVHQISARGDGWGDAKGRVALINQELGFTLKAQVTCMLVFGNQAFITASISTPADAAGDLTVVHVVDNGDGTDQPDLIRFSFEGAIWPYGTAGCHVPTFAPVPVTEGNIVVTTPQS